jgi:RNA polymerase sigma-70 factor (ECF subfamily)
VNDTDFPATLAAAQGGDEAAFTRLYRDAQPRLLRYLRVLAPQVAEDVASETWVRVIAALTGFSGGEAEFRAWLFTIARHKVIDWSRAQARHRTVPLADGESPPRTTAPDTADIALERMSTEAVLGIVATLPAEQAEIIMLRVVAGLDTADVSRIVGKTPGAVRVAAHRALRRLATVAGRAGAAAL